MRIQNFYIARDESPIGKKYIEHHFQFLVDSGYRYEFYQKNSEREFVYYTNDCRVEIYLIANIIDCVIQTKEFARTNITQIPLVGKNFKRCFLNASSHKKIDMIVKLIQENAEVFMLKRDHLQF